MKVEPGTYLTQYGLEAEVQGWGSINDDHYHIDGGHWIGTIHNAYAPTSDIRVTNSWTADGLDCDGYSPWNLLSKRAKPYESLIPVLGISEVEEQRRLRREEQRVNGQIKIGDHVKSAWDGTYLGVVSGIKTVRFYDVQQNGHITQVLETGLQPAPRLTPDEAWAKVPEIIVDGILDWKTPTSVRHDCYVLLGGSGVKVTGGVKERVRNAQARMIDRLGGEIGGQLF